ncbi:MAG: aminoglycoside phosphotransferase family protein [Oscillospiraceae bacterium]|nr:aminoglycoside phosphotransferase family protein [Oscillospiraceae bacterium]
MENQVLDIDIICLKFGLSGELTNFRKHGNGNINRTYMLEFDVDGKAEKYILQNINTEVFKNPSQLMSNVAGVTKHIKKYYSDNGVDPDRRTLEFLQCDNGEYHFIDEHAQCWRIYKFIDDVYTCEVIDNEGVFREAGRAFGEFQNILGSFDVSTLYDTIPDFHNASKRFETFKQAVQKDRASRLANVKNEVDFVLSREGDTHVLTDLIDEGKLPLRVTHNDTKLNNILFDKNTNEGICIIDLDTVMTGLSLYDFGDSIRSGANKTAEDDPNTDNVGIDLGLYEAFVSGYLSTAKSLTDIEKQYLPFSAKLLTLECGMRFLTDYLNGDTYFRTDYPDHNLDRCRNQFKLVEDIENNMETMKKITEKYC